MSYYTKIKNSAVIAFKPIVCYTKKMFFSYLVKIIIAILLGMVVGFERESYTGQAGRGSLGVRSYALISLLGVLLGLIYKTHVFLFMLIGLVFILLLVGYYIFTTLFHKDAGLTTEMAILLNFLFSIFIGLGIFPIQLIIALTVVLVLIMSLKSEITVFVASIKRYEVDAFIAYAIITLVIFPFLPNIPVTLSVFPGIVSLLKSFNWQINSLINVEIVNPFNLWKIVVIITGIDIAGYILEKTIGQKKSWLLTSIAGGFISSTSTTQSLAIRSKKSKNVNGLVAAAVFANFSSFIQHLFLIASINTGLLISAIPYLFSIIGSGLITGLIFYAKSKKYVDKEMRETKKEMKTTQIFSLKPALQFALVFTIIKIVSKVSLIVFGQGGFLVTSALASFTGMDAVTLNVGEITGKIINYKTGILALIFANAINLLAKTFYSFIQGNKYFAYKFGLSSVIVITASLISLIFIH